MSRPLPLNADHNAATAVHSAGWAAYVQALADFAHPSAPHAAGQAAHRRLRGARRAVAAALGAHDDEIAFTSGGTEADAVALCGFAKACPGAHCVTSALEHPAVQGTLRSLAQASALAVDQVVVGPDGVVDVAAVAAALQPRTRLVSLMAANNETGVLQPLPAVVALCHDRGVLVHCDAVQALGRVPVDLGRWGVDFASFAGHKVGAPGGVGVLYVRRGAPWRAPWQGLFDNMPGATAWAAVLATLDLGDAARLGALRDAFEARLQAALPGVRAIGVGAARLPNTSCLHIAGCPGDALMMALDVRGFAVSTGSACSSGSIEASPVLLGMGMGEAAARECVRFSFGGTVTSGDVDGLARQVASVVDEVRGG